MTHTPQLPEPGATITQADSTSTTTHVEPPASWLHRNLRPLVVVAFVGMVLYLAAIDSTHAREAIVMTANSLVSYLFGERSALKTPGKDAS